MRRQTDGVDEILQQWERERPDLPLAAMGTFARLGRLHHHASRAIERVLAQHGLGIPEFDVLAALRRSGAPFVATPSALTRTLMLSPAGMTNRLDRLESAGLVERRLDPHDRRSVLVALTPAGHEAVDRAVTDHVANEEQLLGALAADRRRALDEALRELLASFEPGDA